MYNGYIAIILTVVLITIMIYIIIVTQGIFNLIFTVFIFACSYVVIPYTYKFSRDVNFAVFAVT